MMEDTGIRLKGQRQEFENHNFGKLERPKTPYLFSENCPVMGPGPRFSDLDSVKKAYDADGFVHVRKVFTPSEVSHIASELRRYQKNIPASVPEYDHVYLEGKDAYCLLGRINKYDPFFAKLLDEPRLHELAKLLLEADVTYRHIQFFNLVPGHSPPTPPHQDGFNFLVNDGSSIDIWMPLLDVGETNGCLHYVRGSHHLGRRAHGRGHDFGPPYIQNYGVTDQKNEVAVHAEVGDLVIHHNLTVHGSEPNNTEAERWAITFPFFRKHDLFELSETEWLENKIAGRRTREEVEAIKRRLQEQRSPMN